MSEQNRWNERYANRDSATAIDPPSPFLVAQEPLLRSIPLGRALDVACGTGRNSIYLASLGFEVDAVDISDVVIDWLAGEVERRGLSINAVQTDLTQNPFPNDGYQVIINFRYLQRDLFKPMMNALLPGGLLIFETMHRDYVEKLGNEMNPDFLMGDNELLDAFRGLRILRYEEGLKAIKNSERETALASLVAQKVSR